MAHSNWGWLSAAVPECGSHASRQGIMDKHKGTAMGRFDRRYGSFWNRKEAGQFRPCFNGEGKQVNNPAGKGKVVDVVPHTQPRKGIVIDPVTGEMSTILTG